MITDTQLKVLHNADQGAFTRVLCVCSVGCLRSPTAAYVLSLPPFNCNTRCCGIDRDNAIVPITEALVEWADRIVVFDFYQSYTIKQMLVAMDMQDKSVFNLDIADDYDYRDSVLMEVIKRNYVQSFLE